MAGMRVLLMPETAGHRRARRVESWTRSSTDRTMRQQVTRMKINALGFESRVISPASPSPVSTAPAKTPVPNAMYSWNPATGKSAISFQIGCTLHASSDGAVYSSLEIVTPGGCVLYYGPIHHATPEDILSIDSPMQDE